MKLVKPRVLTPNFVCIACFALDSELCICSGAAEKAESAVRRDRLSLYNSTTT